MLKIFYGGRDMDWISVKDKMPEHGKNVLATYINDYRKHRIVVGHHLKRWKTESDCEDDSNYRFHCDLIHP